MRSEISTEIFSNTITRSVMNLLNYFQEGGGDDIPVSTM
jgi:hypothetical protein